MKNQGAARLGTATLCTAAAVLLPMVTQQIPQVGAQLPAMQFPVLLCGFLCGGGLGFAAGFAAPLIRSLAFGVPLMYPDALVAAISLACLGSFAGKLYHSSKRSVLMTFVSLLAAMALGRLVYGVADLIAFYLTTVGMTFTGTALTETLAAFLPQYLDAIFYDVLLGMAIQIVLIPAIVIPLRNTGLVRD